MLEDSTDQEKYDAGYDAASVEGIYYIIEPYVVEEGLEPRVYWRVKELINNRIVSDKFTKFSDALRTFNKLENERVL